MTSSLSGGRFLAVVPGFLDPVDYRQGQAITVSGSIDGIDVRPLGETAYDYPKVSVVDHQLWVPNNRRFARRGHYRPYLGNVSLGLGFGFNRGFIGINKGFSRFGRRGFGRSGFSRGRGFGRGRFVRGGVRRR